MDAGLVRGIAEANAGRRGPCLVTLQAVQAALGWVPAEAVPIVADVLNLSRAEVHGVLTFYADLRTSPPPEHVVRVCRAEACQANGADAIPTEGTETVYCLGLCGIGPALEVDGVLQLHRPGPHPNRTRGPENRIARVWPSSSMVVRVSGDSASVALGADELAAAYEAAGATVVRTGSRGLQWLEPMAEIDGRAYGADGTDLGSVDELLAGQRRITFARVGAVDPFEPPAAYPALDAALAMAPADVVAAVEASGLRGRGGAGFPTGRKWRTVLDAGAADPGGETFVVANADEGDSGTFADRMLMEGDPFLLLEGMAIAAHAVGARQGWIYVRSEYPRAVAVLEAAVARFPHLPIEVRVGAGAYICGEETAMLESLEGRRGVVRAKPPLPAIEGLFGRPTVVNNVLTFAAVPAILRDPTAPVTHVLQLAGNVERPGIFEVEERTPLRDLIGRTRSGRPIGAVQVGGPLGPYLGPDDLDLAVGFESFAAAGAMLGHGGVVVFDDTVDLLGQARFAMHFCAEESCGKCTPCRIGSVRGREVLDRVLAGDDVAANLALLDDLCEVMADGSLCAMGGLTPNPVRSAVRLSATRLPA